jgi:hypothetical protein
MSDVHTRDLAAQSVLPKVQYEQMAEGVRISKGGTSRLTAIVLLIVGVLVIAFSFGMSVLFYTMASGSRWWLLPIVFVIFGVVLLIVAIRLLMIANAFGPAELFVDNIPLSLGQQLNIRYRRSMRGNYNVTAVSGSLVCQEWVRYKAGTKVRILSKELCSLDLPSPERIVSPLGDIDVAWTITIPRNMPPSFEATDNAIKWLLRVSVQVERFPDPHIELLLPIQPEVIR